MKEDELRSRYWQEKHRHQIYDLGGDGYYIEAHRIDRPDIQDLRIRVFAKGRPIREERFLYNIKYDYYRNISIKNGQILYDRLYNNESYGHLLWEDDIPPKKGSLHPFAYEPVTEAGSEMFQKEGLHIPIKVPELHLWYETHLYNEETYETVYPTDLITDVEEYWNMRIYPDEGKCDPIKERQQRLEFFEAHAYRLYIPYVPVDYRFVD